MYSILVGDSSEFEKTEAANKSVVAEISYNEYEMYFWIKNV